MELLAIALPVILVGAVIGFVLARLTRPRVAGWASALLVALVAVLVWTSRGQNEWDGMGTVIVAGTVGLPLAIGIALGAAIERLRRSFGRRD